VLSEGEEEEEEVQARHGEAKQYLFWYDVTE